MSMFRRGETYRDTGRVADESDQFLRWINIPKRTGILNNPGIRPLLFAERRALGVGLPAALLLVTTRRPGHGSVWDDVIDPKHGTIQYWGDARKHKDRGPLDWNGNRVLKAVADALRDPKMRHLVPPILHFEKPRGGEVRFTGLCALRALDEAAFEEGGEAVANYRAQLDILDAAEVPVAWLHARALADALPPDDRGAPEAWLRYLRAVRSGDVGPDSAALSTACQEAMAGEFERQLARARGQGFSTDPRFNRAVEKRAMEAVQNHFRGWELEDTSVGNPYDYRATRAGETKFIEVKGTTGGPEQVTVTYREVEHAICAPGSTILAVVHGITVVERDSQLVGFGGTLRIVDPWMPDPVSLRPLAYRYTLPR